MQSRYLHTFLNSQIKDPAVNCFSQDIFTMILRFDHWAFYRSLRMTDRNEFEAKGTAIGSNKQRNWELGQSIVTITKDCWYLIFRTFFFLRRKMIRITDKPVCLILWNCASVIREIRLIARDSVVRYHPIDGLFFQFWFLDNSNSDRLPPQTV